MGLQVNSVIFLAVLALTLSVGHGRPQNSPILLSSAKTDDCKEINEDRLELQKGVDALKKMTVLLQKQLQAYDGYSVIENMPTCGHVSFDKDQYYQVVQMISRKLDEYAKDTEVMQSEIDIYLSNKEIMDKAEESPSVEEEGDELPDEEGDEDGDELPDEEGDGEGDELPDEEGKEEGDELPDEEGDEEGDELPDEEADDEIPDKEEGDELQDEEGGDEEEGEGNGKDKELPGEEELSGQNNIVATEQDEGEDDTEESPQTTTNKDADAREKTVVEDISDYAKDLINEEKRDERVEAIKKKEKENEEKHQAEVRKQAEETTTKKQETSGQKEEEMDYGVELTQEEKAGLKVIKKELKEEFDEIEEAINGDDHAKPLLLKGMDEPTAVVRTETEAVVSGILTTEKTPVDDSDSHSGSDSSESGSLQEEGNKKGSQAQSQVKSNTQDSDEDYDSNEGGENDQIKGSRIDRTLLDTVEDYYGNDNEKESFSPRLVRSNPDSPNHTVKSIKKFQGVSVYQECTEKDGQKPCPVNSDEEEAGNGDASAEGKNIHEVNKVTFQRPKEQDAEELLK